MGEKFRNVLIAAIFVCLALLITSSCAKKQVQTSETAQQTAEEAAGAVEKPEVGDTPDYRAQEAERQAKLRELQKEQALADEVQAFESESIYFDFDKSDLKPEAQAVLKRKADWLLKNASYSTWIEGHCDERGTNEYNLALGERRAHSAKRFLVALGVPEGRLKTISYGEERPADPGRYEEAWAKNRRDEFKVIK
jgi:peptidoglycan-associated lipoprotein